MNTKILSIFLLTILSGACSTLAWATTLPESGILMHEESTSEREVKSLKPVLPTNPDYPPSAGAPQEEHLIDGMDVYSLSPHATRLALPRMMAPQFVAMLQGTGTFTPPSRMASHHPAGCSPP